VRAIPTTICWAFGAWIVAAQPQVGPPVTKHPPIPISSKGKIVPKAPSPPFKPKWNLTLPQSLHVQVVAGPDEFFVGSDAGTTAAYASADAQLMWTAPIAAARMAAGDGFVFVSDDKGVHALNQTTGNIFWTIPTGPLATSPVWLPGWLFTEALDGTVAAWRISDGSKLWERALGVPAPPLSPLVIDGDRVFIPLHDRRLVCLKIQDGAMLWSLDLDGIAGTPTAAAGRVYFGSSNYTFYAVKQQNGELEWEPHRMIKSTVIGRPVLDERYIWITTLNNRVQALSRSNGQIEISNELSARPTEQFVIDGGQVIVPLASGEIAVFDQKTGKVLRSPTSVPPPGSPEATAAAAAATAAPTAAPSGGIVPPLPPPPVTATVAPGTRLAPPLVVTGPSDAPVLLRVILNPGSDHIVTAFERTKPAPPAPPPGDAATPPGQTAGTAPDTRTTP
jgi:outer membrane protein assembly factor BamB